MIRRRGIARNQAESIASVLCTVLVDPILVMKIRHQDHRHRAHPQALPPIAHLVTIAGQGKSIARSTSAIGSVPTAVITTALMIAVITTAMMTLLRN